jgi:hypothetical protein
VWGCVGRVCGCPNLGGRIGGVVGRVFWCPNLGGWMGGVNLGEWDRCVG